MKSPDALNSKALGINTPNGLAERQHSVEVLERKSQHLARIGVSPMMRIVQQCRKAHLMLQRQNRVHYLGIIPFMNNYDVSALNSKRKASVKPESC